MCLFDKFPSEMNDLLSCCIARGKQTKIPLQLIACSSTYSEDNFNNFLRYSKAPVTVMTDMIEVLAMKKVKMVRKKEKNERREGEIEKVK